MQFSISTFHALTKSAMFAAKTMFILFVGVCILQTAFNSRLADLAVSFRSVYCSAWDVWSHYLEVTKLLCNLFFKEEMQLQVWKKVALRRLFLHKGYKWNLSALQQMQCVATFILAMFDLAVSWLPTTNQANNISILVDGSLAVWGLGSFYKQPEAQFVENIRLHHFV